MTTMKQTFFVAGKELTVYAATPFDSSPHLASKVLIHPQGRVSYLSSDGRMFSTLVTRSGFFGRRWHGHESLIRDALALGLLPKKAGEQLLKREAVHRDRRNRQIAANDLLSAAVAFGIVLPAKVLSAAKKASRYKGRRGDR